MARGAWLAALLCITTGGCTGKAETLEREYERSGTPDEKCERAKRVADAWLEARNEKKHESWSLTRDIDCLHADALNGR